MGSQATIFLNHPKKIRKLFCDSDLKRFTNDRPPTFIGKYITYDTNNTAFTHSTPVQRQRRKVFHSVMKFYGDNVDRIEAIILENISNVVGEMKTKSEIELSVTGKTLVSKIIHIMLAGSDTPTPAQLKAMTEFNKRWEEFFVFEIETVLQCFPFLRYIPGLPYKQKYDDLYTARNELLKHYYYGIKQTHVIGQERGIVDHLLTYQHNLGEKGDTNIITDDTVKASTIETIAASYVSSAAIVNILFLCLCRHKHI